MFPYLLNSSLTSFSLTCLLLVTAAVRLSFEPCDLGLGFSVVTKPVWYGVFLVMSVTSTDDNSHWVHFRLICVCVCVRARAGGKEPFILPLGSVCVFVQACIWCGTWVFSVCACTYACMSACVCLCLSRSVAVSIYVIPAPAWNNDTIIVNRPSPSSVDYQVYEVTRPCSEIVIDPVTLGPRWQSRCPIHLIVLSTPSSLFARFSRAVCLFHAFSLDDFSGCIAQKTGRFVQTHCSMQSFSYNVLGRETGE